MSGRWLQYLLTAVTALAAGGWVLDLRHADLRVPMAYDGDAVLHQLWLKTHGETGWFSFNDRFGAPGAMDLNEFPQADLLHYVILWPICKLTQDPALDFNLYYLLGFPLAAMACLFLARSIGIGFLPGFVASVLYACLPFHFIRMGHFFLAAYFLVPIGIWLAMLVYRGIRIPRVGGLLAAVCVGAAGVYYAFFTCFLIAFAGLARAVSVRSLRPLAAVCLPVAVVSVSLLLSLAPAIRAKMSEPFNADATKRDPGHSEILGLKLTHLILPVQNHRVDRLAKINRNYDLHAPLQNENRSATLGAVGAVGFAFLFGWFLFARREGRVIDGLALLAVGAFLLGSIAAFGAVFSLAVSPWIRGYNRISVFIGAIALVAVALLLDHASRRFSSSPGRITFALGCLGILAIGLLDETTPAMAPRHADLAKRYMGDAEFVREIEARTDAGGMVAMLPYRYFPESPGEPEGITFTWYDQLRPELHSKTLRWTAGAPRGRYGNLWQKRMDAKEFPARVEALAIAGCAGLLIFREAYKDGAQGMEFELKEKLGVEPLISPDARMVYFPLKDLESKLRSGMTEDSYRKCRRSEAEPVLAAYGIGAGPERQTVETMSRTCDGSTELWLLNPTAEKRRVWLRIEAMIRQPTPGAVLSLSGVEGHPSMPLTDMPALLQHLMEVPPGKTRVRLECDADDGRKHHFEIHSVECLDE